MTSILDSTTAWCAALLLATPCAAQWSTDSLALARYEHAAAESGGLLFFGGGFAQGKAPTDSVEVYDPAGGTWSTLSLSVPRMSLAAAATGGIVAFAGGFEKSWACASDVVDLYDTATGTWSVTHLPQAVFGFAGVGVDTKLIFHGGIIEGGGALTVAQVYDLATGTWSSVDLQAGIRGWGATATDGRRAFLVGGGGWTQEGSETLNIYDSLTDQWSKVTMPNKHPSVRAVAHLGKLYVTGGCFVLRLLDIYDIETGTWESTLLPGEGRCEHVSTAVGPYVIFAGGLNYSFDSLATADILNTVTGEWITTPISVHGAFAAGAASADDNTVVIAGGQVNTQSHSYTDAVDVFRYQASIGTPYCGPANLNSSGKPATLSAFGVDTAADSFLTLVASDLATNQFGYFLASETQGFIPLPGGSQGNLCLSGDIARIRDQILFSGDDGTFALTPNLHAIPTHPPSTVLRGETWNFQAWFRDHNPAPTSNFTDGLAVTFT